MPRTTRTHLRMVVWNGDKFLYFGQDNFLRKEDVTLLSDDPREDTKTYPASQKAAFYPAMISGATWNSTINGTSTMQIEMRNVKGRLYVRTPKERDLRSFQDILSNFWTTFKGYLGRPFEAKDITKPLDQIGASGYKHGMWSFLYPTGGDFSGSIPELFIPPGSLIWVDAWDPYYKSSVSAVITRDYRRSPLFRRAIEGRVGFWRRVFVGVVTQVSSTKDQTLTISATDMLALLQQTPLCSETWGVMLSEGTLDSQDPHYPFYKGWLSSLVPMQVKATLGEDQNTSSGQSPVLPTNILSNLSISELMDTLAGIANRALGAVKASSLRDYLQKLRLSSGRIPYWFWELPDSTIDAFLKDLASNRFYPFPDGLFKSPQTYEDVDGVVQDDYPPSALIKGGVVPIRIDPRIKEFEEYGKDISPFQRLMEARNNLMNFTYTVASAILQGLQQAFHLYLHQEADGGIVLEWPLYNALPKISSSSLNSLPGEDHEGVAGGDLPLYGKDYVIVDPEISTWVHRFDYSNVVTHATLPFTYHFMDLDLEKVTPWRVNSLGTPAELLRFGLKTRSFSQMFAGLNIMGTSAEEFEGFRDWWQDLTDSLRYMNNAPVESFSFSLVNRLDLKCNRNVVIPLLEKTYLLSSISYRYTPGVITVNCVGLFGKAIEDTFPEPWKKLTEVYFPRDVKQEMKEYAYELQKSLGRITMAGKAPSLAGRYYIVDLSKWNKNYGKLYYRPTFVDDRGVIGSEVPYFQGSAEGRNSPDWRPSWSTFVAHPQFKGAFTYAKLTKILRKYYWDGKPSGSDTRIGEFLIEAAKVFEVPVDLMMAIMYRESRIPYGLCRLAESDSSFGLSHLRPGTARSTLSGTVSLSDGTHSVRSLIEGNDLLKIAATEKDETLGLSRLDIIASSSYCYETKDVDEGVGHCPGLAPNIHKWEPSDLTPGQVAACAALTAAYMRQIYMDNRVGKGKYWEAVPAGWNAGIGGASSGWTGASSISEFCNNQSTGVRNYLSEIFGYKQPGTQVVLTLGGTVDIASEICSRYPGDPPENEKKLSWLDLNPPATQDPFLEASNADEYLELA